MKSALTGAVLVILSLNAHAVESDEYTVLGGIGLASCASYVKDFKNDYYATRFSTWANGYISHFNRVNYKTMNIAENVDLTARQQWIYEYCKKNPLDVYEQAVSKLIDELVKRNK